eukprot:TRINITY_DN7530_c0_g1_i1.p2 TRINITY_DN7530_c0_g1~~TRINITY_DN7530_c0_g1_i1.p2  ORF type:complete len:162 (-),score=9.67 TRINITY_DN7530_c0_g1_i1:7-492(-)
MADANQSILCSLDGKFRPARKVAGVRAVRVCRAVELGLVSRDLKVQTLEGVVVATPTAMLCYGSANEPWLQSEEKLLQKYAPAPGTAFSQVEVELTTFVPKPDAQAVLAAQHEGQTTIAVQSQWGVLTGQPLDYVVYSPGNPSDVWIVAHDVFEQTYQFVD